MESALPLLRGQEQLVAQRGPQAQMNNQLFTEYRQFRKSVTRLLHALLAEEKSSARVQLSSSLELELRFGRKETTRRSPCTDAEQRLIVSVDRGRFNTDVDARLFLALFQRLSESDDWSVQRTLDDRVQRLSAVTGSDRVLHQPATDSKSRCRREHKQLLTAHQDFESSDERRLDVRLSLCSEQVMDSDVCNGAVCHFDGKTVRRERCTAVAKAGFDLWRVDFTKLDDGQRHQIELELQLDHAHRVLQPAYAKLQQPAPVTYDQYLVHNSVERLVELVDELQRLACQVDGQC